MVESDFPSPLKFHAELTFVTDPADNCSLWAPIKSSETKNQSFYKSLLWAPSFRIANFVEQISI